MQLSRLASHAYYCELQGVLHDLYAAARAYACLTLKPSASMTTLGAVDGMADLDSDALAAALAVLVSELAQFRTDLAQDVRTLVPDLTLSATSSLAPSFIKALAASREVSFFLGPKLGAEFHGFDQLTGKFDIRVTKAKAYLIGATSPDPQIQVNVTSGGRCQVEPFKPEQSIAWFNLPETVRSNIYTVDASGAITDVSTEDVAPTEMTWGGGDDDNVSAALLPIYTQWTVSVPDDAVGLGSVSEVRLVFDISFRPQEAGDSVPGPAAPAEAVAAH
jgi:hypothetical protein